MEADDVLDADVDDVDDDADDAPDEAGEDLAAVAPEEPAADPRARYAREAAQGLRQRPDIRASGRQTVAPASAPSPWVGKSREELSAWARDRAATMSATAVGRTVKGEVNTP